MQAYLDRNFWLVNLLVVAILAGLSGLVAATATESFLIVGERAKKGRKSAKKKKKKKSAQAGLRKSQFDVTRRNIFCSDCEPAKPGAKKDPDEPTARMEDAELLATLVSDDPKWSFATIRFKKEQMVRMVNAGYKIKDAEIIKVESKRVTFRQGKETGIIELIPGEGDGEKPKVKKKPGKAKKGKPKGKRAKWRQKLKQGVRKLGKNKYEIDRSLVSEITANIGMAGRDAAIYPHTKNGKPDGFRLGRVRPGGIFAKLGMRSGDVLNSINNTPITSPDKLLDLYTKLMGASHLTIGISRYGRPQTMDYSIK